METSESITNLLIKIDKISTAAPEVKRKGSNVVTNSTYVTLSSVMDVLRPLFEEHRINVMSFPHTNGLRTRITDLDTGEFMIIFSDSPLATTLHEMGSTITYLRRYTLMSIFNLVPEDDDGNNTILSSVEQRKETIRQKKEAAALAKKEAAALAEPELTGDFAVIKDTIANEIKPKTRRNTSKTKTSNS